ncbi:hypothetical protein L9F63_027901 [Diploptera punctata]|uniref:SOCS box domain-containing protein n=1 Tax=Diploptera punctata TaxID=6984 RepID=A0AAD8EH09_DIPPU|nr:hypothetical protein L9F63_027901 [Diploptera punctata]
MDAILDCYFDNIFCKLERSSLMARYKRRELVSYLSTVIEGCARGEDCDVSGGARCAVMAALRYHDASKASNGSVCLMGKYHNIIYVAAKLCFDWKIQDNQIVVQLLNNIYHCERTFERLFIGAIFGTRVTYMISGWKSDFENAEENTDAIKYFLEHATEAKLEYDDMHDGSKTRFIDIPLESYGRAQPIRLAAQFSNKNLLLLLLRYGANVKINYERDEVTIETPLKQLNALCNANCSLDLSTSIIECLKILLRAIPTMATFPCSTYDGRVYVLVDTVFGLDRMYYHSKLIEEGIIPPSRTGFTPPELKHLCRCSIRDILRQNWQLPHGIQKLDIPFSLKEYLDLLED